MRYWLIIFIVQSIAYNLAAQSEADTLASLPLLIVKDQIPEHSKDPILDSEATDELPLAASFSIEDLIRQQAAVWVRRNGNHTLSTLSIRGSSSQQAVISWNGAQLNSPMLGLSDISNLPAILMEEISIQKAGSSELYNPIGGEMSLRNQISQEELSAGLRIGQFQDQQYYLRAKKVWNHWRMSLSTFCRKAEQNFPYLEPHQSILLPSRQPHARHLNYGGIGQVERNMGTHKLGVRAWIQNTHRELPPKITQRKSSAEQQDSIRRLQLFWMTDSNRYSQNTTYTYSRESNAFSNEDLSENALNRFKQHQLNSIHHYDLSVKMQLSLGTRWGMQDIMTNNYSENKQLVHWEVFPSLQFIPLSGKWWIKAEYRYARQNQQEAPFGGAVEAGYWLDPNTSLKIIAQKSVRFPSGNDLFWQNLGNPDLRPESAEQIQLEFATKKQWNKAQGEISTSAYYKFIDNWILWAPIEGLLFRPYNVLKVISVGTEVSGNLSYNWNQSHQTRFSINYAFQYIRNKSGQNSPAALAEGPLIYQPEQLLNLWAEHQWGPFKLRYIHDYRSQIYTAADLSSNLPALHIGSARASWTWLKNKFQLEGYVTVENLWNQDYFFQPNLPAPGVQIQAGMHFKL